VVHVEVDDGHALEAMALQRMRAAMATLLKKQKPMACSRQAWWPGGRTAQKAFSSSPAITASVAAMAAPAARSAAQVKRFRAVSGSICAWLGPPAGSSATRRW
jgi:hypothetical protein